LSARQDDIETRYQYIIALLHDVKGIGCKRGKKSHIHIGFRHTWHETTVF